MESTGRHTVKGLHAGKVLLPPHMLAVDLAKIADEESVLISGVAGFMIDILNAVTESITDHLFRDFSAILLVIIEEGILQKVMAVILVSNRGNALDGSCCHNHILQLGGKRGL